MLRNYLRIAFRHLLKNRTHAFINITGLAAGMAVALLIGLWIWDELSFNQYNKNYHRIAQVMQKQTVNGSISTWSSMPRPVGDGLRQGYGDHFQYVVMSSWTQTLVLQAGDQQFVKSGNYMEPQAPDMLDIKMLKGSRQGLKDPHSILLCASLAQTLFGDADPMDRIIKVNNKLSVKVTGVYADLPKNSSFAGISCLLPWQLLISTTEWIRDLKGQEAWGLNGFQTFVQLADHADMDQVSARIRNVKMDNIPPEDRRFHPQLFLHPMRKWHLYERFENGVNTGGRIEFVWLFGIIGFFVLLLACINFMNLSTARSEKRAKEVGIRKAVGSLRGQLISQFFTESLLMVTIAFILSLLLVQLALPFFNQLTDKQMTVLWRNPVFWLICLVFCFITGLIAGSYPAFYLSAFRPIKVLKGTFRVGRLAVVPRRVLVVIQFTVSIILIIGTIIVFNQVQHARNRPMGYNYNNLIQLQMMTGDVHQHFEAVRNDLKNAGAIVEMAGSAGPVTSVWYTNGTFNWKDKDPALSVDFPNTGVSYDFGKTVGWEFKAGRDFSREFASDSAAFVITESAAKFMGLKNPVGEIIEWDYKPYKVIGVIRDMIVESPFYPVRPSLYCIAKSHDGYTVMKLSPAISTTAALDKIEGVLKKYAPAQPFNYEFVDEAYGRKFDNETRIGKLASSFAVLAIFISCLGLFGMALFMAEQRTKEIGIRKVLGASVLDLWQLLSREFLLLVLIALVIAAPIAYYGMQRWLEGYEYRTAISWWVFAVTGFGALLIALATVSGQSVKAALMNPVKSLRTE